MMKKLNLTFLTLCLFVSVVTLAQESETSTNNEYSFKGLYNSTDIGLLIGSSKNNLKSPFSFMTVMGYHINNKFSAGVGIGADFIEETYIPIVIDIRYHFRKSNFSPYVFIQSGYIVSTANEINLNSNQYIMDIWPGPYNPSEAKPTGGFTSVQTSSAVELAPPNSLNA